MSNEIAAEFEFLFKRGKGKVTFSVGFVELPIENYNGGVLSWTRGYYIEDFNKVVDASFDYVNQKGPTFKEMKKHETNDKNESDFCSYLINHHIIKNYKLRR